MTVDMASVPHHIQKLAAGKDVSECPQKLVVMRTQLTGKYNTVE